MSAVTTTADYHQHQYESWKRLVPYLYEWFANHSLVWPSLSCCWGARPDNLMDMVQENKKTSLQGGRVMPTNRAGSWSHAGRVHDSGAVLYLSEQTDGSVMNTLVMAYLDIPKKKGQYGGAAVNGSPPQQLHVAKTILHPGEVNKVVDIPQYPGVVVTHSDSAEVYVWNMNTQPDRVASPKDTEASVADVVLVGHAENAEFALGRSDVKALVASGGKDRNVLVWNIENVCKGGKRTTLSPDAVLEGHEDTVEDVAFKPGSCFDLASVADDSALILWDTRQTKFTSIVRDAHGKKKDVHCCDWSALTPTRLVTGAQDGSVHVWDTRKMETPVFEFRHHTQAVMNVAWSPHSKDVFATGSDDGLVCLWDVSRGGSGQQKNLPVPDELLLQHAGHQTSVVDFCWNPDEPWTIMSASVDSSTGKGGGTLQTWKVSDLVYKSEEQIMSELEPGGECVHREVGFDFHRGLKERARIVARGTNGLLVVETQDPLTTWMVLNVCTALTLHVERHTRIGAFLSSPLLAILLSFVASGVLHVLPVGGSSVYSAVSAWLLPLGVAMYVLEVDVSKVFSKEMSTMLLAFVLGAFGTIVGTLVSCLVFLKYLGIDGPHVVSALCASYIGGSVNFAAVIGGLGTVRADTIPTAMSVDNLIMCLYIAVLMFLSYFVPDDEKQQHTTDEPRDSMEDAVSPCSLATAIATGLASTSLAYTCAAWLGMPSLGLALVSLVACLAAPVSSFIRSRFNMTTTKDTVGIFGGSTSLASVLMTLFFCTIGAQAGQIHMGKESIVLFGFITLQLSIQLLVSLGLGKVCGVPLRTMLIACNANVGGAATAVAMTVSKQWRDLFQPALLAASFGYVIANPCGFAMSMYIKNYII